MNKKNIVLSDVPLTGDKFKIKFTDVNKILFADCYDILLGSGITSSGACLSVQFSYKIDSVDFYNATKITINDCDIAASSGYYSDFNYVRYWNGTVLSEPDNC